MGNPLRRASQILGLPMLMVLAALPAAAQSTRTFTNEKHGFKIRVPRYLKAVPTKPDEEQILAKYKGTKRFKSSRRRNRKGKWVKHTDVPLEVWVVRIRNPKVAGRVAAITQSGRSSEKPSGAQKRPVDIAEEIRRRKNSGRTIKEFLDLRLRGAGKRMQEAPPDRPLKNRDREVYSVLALQGQGQVRSYTVVHEHEHFGHELFGLVLISPLMKRFESEASAVAKSLQRVTPRGKVYAKTDPYAGSSVRDIPRRRAVRARLIEGWYAEDTENFILVTDLPKIPSNTALLRDMLLDLEIMRTVYEKRFPPVEPLSVVCTVRVCNSYDGYIRYSSKPGTGGYWHPIAEELVLFKPVGKIKKMAWMRKVTPKAILYHEAMHQYLHYANGEMPPASWFNEGYGEFYGGAKTDRFEKRIRLIEKNDFRWQVIRATKKTGKWPELKRLLAMTQQQFYSRKSKDYPVLNNYAFGWAFCYFLEQEREKPKSERNEEWASVPDRYLANLRAATAEIQAKQPANAPKGSLFRFAIPAQKQAFEATFGKTDFAPLQSAWVEAMKSWR